MELNNEENQPNFPTFTPLEDIVETQETEVTESTEAPKDAEEDSSEEVAETKKESNDKGKEESTFAPLDLENTEETVEETEDIEISSDEAIDNYNKAVAMGIFEVPDEDGFQYDGSEEATEKVHAYTLKKWEEKGKAQLFEKISDPYLQELVNYGMDAGSFADLEGFGKTLKDHQEVNSVDLSNTEEASELVKKHLSGLGNSSRIINKVIADAIENDELEEFGLEAKDYFSKIAEAKIAESKQVDAKAAQEHKVAQEQYEQDFMDTLKERKLKSADRNSILNAFGDVELNNGNKIPEYQYKLEQIKQNPSDFIELLQILGKYESGKGFNLGNSKKEKTAKIKSIYETLNGKGGTIVKSSGSARGSSNSPFIPKFEDTIKSI